MVLLLACLCVLAPTARPAGAQNVPATVPALLLSDIHFDPFHDPDKVAALEKAPPQQWQALLDAADSRTQPADAARLSAACAGGRPDTTWTLLRSTLRSAREQQPHPLFITVSGDLLAHKFECRFRTATGDNDPAHLTAFAEHTVAFLAHQLRQTFPGVPVYFALGNNDSACGDYREDPGSAFLRENAAVVADEAAQPHQREQIERSFSALGDYSVPLPAPLHHSRLLVLQDIFASTHHRSCGGAQETSSADAQITWLKSELDAARRRQEAVWVMAHIPPGIDAYATLTGDRDVCSGGAPAHFLASDALASVLAEYADVVRLALFGHTHMDELRVFRNASGAAVPGKLVPSVTTSNGNKPSYMLAEVNPADATLADYTVMVAADAQGSSWKREYRFSESFGEHEFSGAAAARLVDALTRAQPPSAAYLQFFSPGDGGLRALALSVVWPSYVCALQHSTADSYRQCVCSAKAPAQTAAPPQP